MLLTAIFVLLLAGGVVVMLTADDTTRLLVGLFMVATASVTYFNAWVLGVL
jgi:hypothetical protein